VTDSTSGRAAGLVLVVDDHPDSLEAMATVLRRSGFQVDEARHGQEGAQAITVNDYDAVLTDISMPGMSGMELLQLVRAHDPDLPVVLITGAPTVQTAIDALEYGAFKYLLKPAEVPKLVEAVRKAVLMRRMARVRREATRVAAGSPDPELRASFEKARGGLWSAFQPIVTRDGELYGYEALMRSRDKTLPHPGAILDAAERLGELRDLGRRMRDLAARPMVASPEHGVLFVNLHPRDLEDDRLVSPEALLSTMASRVVLEITERASVDSISDLRDRVTALRARGFRIAVDDLGAGYAGLTSFALLEPDIVKIDMSLVRDIDSDSTKQRLILSVVSLCRELGIEIVGEGVETQAERDKLCELGCDLLQGYLFAKPSEAFPQFTW